MAQAQGYRQPRPPSFQGHHCHALGMSSQSRPNSKHISLLDDLHMAGAAKEQPCDSRHASDLESLETDWLLILPSSTDRLWLQQEDPPHDALRPQGLPRQQHQGR